MPPFSGLVDIGSFQEVDPGQVYALEGADALVKHEAYNSDNLDNDIALLRLSRNVQLSSRVRTICLPQFVLKSKSIQYFQLRKVQSHFDIVMSEKHLCPLLSIF